MEPVSAQLCFNGKEVSGSFDSAGSNFHPNQPLGEAAIIELEDSMGEIVIRTSDTVVRCGIAGVDWSGVIHVTVQLPPEA